jgi:hypothetical protein
VFLFQQPVTTAVIVVDGSCSLADAIAAANTDAPVRGCASGAGSDEIQLTGDVTLIEPLPLVFGTVTFEGNSHSVSRYAGVDACGLDEDQRGLARDELCDSGSFEFGAQPFGLGGMANGVRTRQVSCRNVSNGSFVQIDLQGASSWDCEAAGFVADSGDQIGQALSGGVLGQVSGAMTGILASEVTCQNRTTGQEVTAALDAQLGWNCSAAGLAVSNGDRLRITVVGQAP